MVQFTAVLVSQAHCSVRNAVAGMDGQPQQARPTASAGAVSQIQWLCGSAMCFAHEMQHVQ